MKGNPMDRYSKDGGRALTDRIDEAVHSATLSSALKALNDLIDAWEMLAGGRNYQPSDVERWLIEHMAPAVNSARKVLGRKKPGG